MENIQDNVLLKELKSECAELKKRIMELKMSRKKRSIVFNRVIMGFKAFNSLLVLLMILGDVFDWGEKMQKVMTLFLALSSLSFWTNLEKKAMDHLTKSYDLQTAEDLIKSYSKRIDEITSDNVISDQQQVQLSNMIVNIDAQLFALTECGRIFDVLMGLSADPEIKDACDKFVKVTKKYSDQQKTIIPVVN